MEFAADTIRNLDTLDFYRMGFIVLVILVGFALTDWGLE
jgi:hypothetical protein